MIFYIWKRFLRLTGLSPRRFLGLTAPLAPRVVVSPLRGDEYEDSVTGFAFPPHRHPERSEGSRYLKHMRQSVVNTSQREGAAYSGRWWAPFNSCKTPLIIKPYNRALARREDKPTSLRSLEMHPFWCCAPLPPEGEVCSMLFFSFIYDEQP